MNQIKVKTKETVKGVKALDKAAIAGERMKNAYIRTRETAVRNREDRGKSPTEYAEDRVQDAARNMARNAARIARFGGKVIRQKGEAPPRQQEHREGEPPPEGHDTMTPKGPNYKESFAPEDTPSTLSSQNPAVQKQQYKWYRIKKTPTQGGHDTSLSSISYAPTAPTPEIVTERGREFAKKQAAKRSKAAREIKTRELIANSQQRDRAALSMLPDTAFQGIGAETADRTALPLSAKRRGASQSAAKGGADTVRQIVPRKIKAPKHRTKAAVQTVQKVERAAHETAQAAVKAERISRFAAKSAATAAKKAAKISAKAIKAILQSAKALAAAIASGGITALLGVVVICLVGQLVYSGFGIFFSGEDNGTGQTVLTAIREINGEFAARLSEIEASVEYDILDISGSCAPWSDILAVYAVRTTTNPDDGQEVVTMDDGKKALLKKVFWDMNQIDSWVTEEVIEVSGTTTDTEGNTVDTTDFEIEVTLHISISHKTAHEMADLYRFDTHQREQLDFLLSDENLDLWDALLRGVGAIAGGGGGGDIVFVALSQIGNVGGEIYWRWYGFDSRVEWCACFVSWCANESGCLGTSVPMFSSCTDGAAWFKAQGRWKNGFYLPQPGDVIFFDWDTGGGQDGRPDHVGIVERVEGGVIYTIEGNSRDQCRENRYTVRNFQIYGYGVFSH